MPLLNRQALRIFVGSVLLFVSYQLAGFAAHVADPYERAFFVFLAVMLALVGMAVILKG